MKYKGDVQAYKVFDTDAFLISFNGQLQSLIVSNLKQKP
jgi:hypothetical protein